MYCQDVYEKAGLLGPRTVLAHCVHMTDRDWTRMNKVRLSPYGVCGTAVGSGASKCAVLVCRMVLASVQCRCSIQCHRPMVCGTEGP